MIPKTLLFNPKSFLILMALFFGLSTFAQKDGKYLVSDDPVCELWEFEGDEEKEEGAPIIDEMAMQYFFLVTKDSRLSMMSPFYMEDMGFACPTYFEVAKDKKFLYLDIKDACRLDLPEEEKYVKLRYELEDDGKRLILIIGKNKYAYKHWD